MKENVFKWYPVYILVCLALTSQSQFLDKVVPLLQYIEEYSRDLSSDPVEHKKYLLAYDFIIVGAGTAGCVLANRLTENPNWEVLLIEAGDDEKFLMDIPVTALYNQFTSANWGYKTEPSNKYCTGLKNKQCMWPRGKVMGGSSVLNYMIYTRGSQGDYDNWKALGNEGWGWNDVLPYFKKIENFNITSHFNSHYHNRNGYLNVEYAPFESNWSKAWVSAAEEFGFKNVDYNGAAPSGVSRLQLSMKNGTRHSSNRAYIHPIKDRSNLYISKNSLVTKLMFDQSNTKVIGVQYIMKNNRTRIAFAKKEVILSAGAINSPQLLMISGIGPKDHLEQMKIKVISDLPVGFNLMDHIATGGLHFIVNDDGYDLESIVNDLDHVINWMKDHKGPLSLPGASESIIFMNHNDKFNCSLLPDVELLFFSHGLAKNPKYKDLFGIKNDLYENTFQPLSKYPLFFVFPMLLRPKSRGRIMLRSRDPKVHPIIIPNYLSYDEDVKKIIEGIKVAIEISKQPSMKKLGARLYNVPFKECLEWGEFGSDAYFACQTTMLTFTIYHQSGTCKMGIKSDPSAVVSPRLKVHGIKNLRVIDASVMPEIPAGHINAPTYMVAEKGAEMIKEDHDFFLNDKMFSPLQ